MDYIEQQQQTIRDHWFDKHTVSRIDSHGGNDYPLRRYVWSAPGTSLYEVVYTFSGNMVFISGDLGDAAYALTCRATLENLASFDLHYFTSKLTAHSRDKYKFDETYAIEELAELFCDMCDVDTINDLRKDDRRLYDQLVGAAKESASPEQFERAVFEQYDETSVEWFDSESAHLVSRFGRRLSGSLIAYWLGLQMLCDQLDAERRQALQNDEANPS